MSAILGVNNNYPKGLRGLQRNDGNTTQGYGNTGTICQPTPLDSGNIVANGKSGVGPRRLTMGIEGRASSLTCDATAGVAGNYIPPAASNSPQTTSNAVPNATITQVAVSNANGSNGVATVSTLTVTATNSFVTGNIVTFSGLTTLTALNGLAAKVTSATGSSFVADIIQFTVPTQGGTADTGTASLNYTARASGLGVGEHQ